MKKSKNKKLDAVVSFRITAKDLKKLRKIEGFTSILRAFALKMIGDKK